MARGARIVGSGQGGEAHWGGPVLLYVVRFLAAFVQLSPSIAALIPALSHAFCVAVALADAARFSNNRAVSMALIFSAIATTKNWFIVVSSEAAIRLTACLILEQNRFKPSSCRATASRRPALMRVCQPGPVHHRVSGLFTLK